MLQGVYAALVDQRRIGAECEQALHHRRMAVDDSEYQRRSAGRVGCIQNRLKRHALREQAFELRDASGAGGLLQRDFCVGRGFLFCQSVRCGAAGAAAVGAAAIAIAIVCTSPGCIAAEAVGLLQRSLRARGGGR